MSWKQRLYAFLLRRVLGPYLTPSSSAKLHESIQVSLSDGTFELRDVQLDPTFLSTHFSLLQSSGLELTNATISKLVIVLSLQDPSDSSSWSSYVLASSSGKKRDGTNNNSNGGKSRMALVAHVEIDGMHFQLAPRSTPAQKMEEPLVTNPPPVKTAGSDASSGSGSSMIASYVDSALNSLRLSLKLSNVSLRILGTNIQHAATVTPWAEIRLGSASYNDSLHSWDGKTQPQQQPQQSKGEAIMFKSLEFSGISLSTGALIHNDGELPLHLSQESSVMRVLQTDGGGQLRVKVTAWPGDQNQKLLQHDVELSLNKSVNASIDSQSMIHISDILDSIASSNEDHSTNHHTGEQIVPPLVVTKDTFKAQDDFSRDKRSIPIETTESENDDDGLSSIMKQYAEARHSARTRELRGGLLLPSNAYEENGSDEEGFDAFFDANDQSFHHYRSILSESISGLRKNEENKADSSNVDRNAFVHTKLKFQLRESKIKVTFPNDSDTPHQQQDYLLLSLGDLNMSASLSHAWSDLSVMLDYFEVEEAVFSSQLPPTLATQDERLESVPTIRSIIRFVESGGEAGSRMMTDVVSTAPCISLHVSMKNAGNEYSSNHCTIEATTEPLEITYQQSMMDNITRLMESSASKHMNQKRVPSSTSTPLTDDGESSTPMSLQFDLNCQTITVFLPVATGNGPDPERYQTLFQRCGSVVPNATQSSSFILGCVFDGCTANISRNSVDDSASVISGGEEKTAFIAFQHALLFARAPNNTESPTTPLHSSGMIHVDLMALSGDTAIDPDSVVQIDFSSSQKQGKNSSESDLTTHMNNFPLVPPLSTVKARQEYDSDDDEQVSGATDGKNSSLKIRGEDVQYGMSAEASDCGSSIHIQVPHIVFDLTLGERRELISLISALRTGTKDDESDGTRKESDVDLKAPPSFKIAVAVSFDQVSVCLHDEALTKESGSDDQDVYFSYVIVAGGIKAHTLLTSHGIRNVRFLVDDFTLYEATNLMISHNSEGVGYYRPPNVGVRDGSIFDRCRDVRRRSVRNPLSNAKPLLQRSKLGFPLSPETPAFMLDILIRKTWNCYLDEEDVERTVYLHLYDVTHRYTFDSDWLSRFTNILKGGNQESTKEKEVDNDVMSKIKQSETSSSEGTEEASCVTSLFVSLSDCCVDYTSPIQFATASRSNIRVSEIRVSSNIVAPVGPVQAYKITVDDISLDLSNIRYPHNMENSRLLGSRTLMNAADLSVGDGKLAATWEEAPSVSDALRVMNFIPIFGLDSIDATLTIARNDGINIASTHRGQEKPNVTATTSIGTLTIDSCRDSFACLSSTIGEWQLNMATPSDEEIAALRSELESKLTGDGESAGNVSDSMRSEVTPPSSEKIRNVQHHTESFAESNEPVSLLFDAIGHDMFSNLDTEVLDRATQRLVEAHQEVTEYTSQSFVEIPDNELTASELRNKHTLVQKDHMSTDLAKTLLIKNFYTVDTTRKEPVVGTFKPAGIMSVEEAPDDASLSYNESAQHNLSSGDSPLKDDESPLGGYDWMTVDHEWSRNTSIPDGKEESAIWYDSVTPKSIVQPQPKTINVFPQHVPIIPVPDPLNGGDMNAAKFAGTSTPPAVNLRLIVKKMTVKCRFFDGYDWVSYKMAKLQKKPSTADKRSQLMGQLMETQDGSDFFREQPLPEERRSRMDAAATEKRLARQTNRYLQISLIGLKLRLDSFVDVPDHRLASCLDLTFADMFMAESVSGPRPVKLLGEWLNEKEHPRDSNDGLVMMKMVSMHPLNKMSADGKLMSDESRVKLELLPLRLFIHQRSLRFVRQFFSGEEETNVDNATVDPEENAPKETGENEEGIAIISPTFFQLFTIEPCKLKVNYTPERMDAEALRDGSYVELINLMPLEDMVLTMKQVDIINTTGWGAVIGELANQWIQDIVRNQLRKFITNATPFHTLTNLGGAVAELVVLPWEEMRHDGNFAKGMRTGTTTFAGAVAYETLNTTSKLTKYAANRLSSATNSIALSPTRWNHNNHGMHDNSRNHAATNTGGGSTALPSRPDRVPRHAGDAAGHALESFTRGLKTANYKIVIVPYREYQRNGPAGAARSVVRGIPVAVLAPLSGATEALSYTLLGVRNQLRPDIRKEEEATQKGMHML